jgi:cyclic beta-1,2-glucan synthetase
VLSAAGQPPRAALALDSAQSLLWEPQAGVMRLLHPPLQHASPAAGYIQAYPPGVRENGGQYNHGAVWALMAAARLQRADWAWRLFTAVSPAHRATADPAYGAEPYAVAAEVYTVAPRAGQAGWSWYTGSAGWLLRAALESICGVTLQAGVLRVTPCLPADWDTVTVWLRDGERRVRVLIVRDAAARQQALAAVAGEASVTLVAGAPLKLRDLPAGHSVLVQIDVPGPGGLNTVSSDSPSAPKVFTSDA